MTPDFFGSWDTGFEKNRSEDDPEKTDFAKINGNPTNYISIDRAHQTEQLLSRHLMVIYYSMRGMKV